MLRKLLSGFLSSELIFVKPLSNKKEHLLQEALTSKQMRNSGIFVSLVIPPELHF